MMRKVYYLAAALNVNSISQPHTYLASAVGYNKQAMQRLLAQRQSEYPEWLFWIGDQDRTREGLDKILKMKRWEQ